VETVETDELEFLISQHFDGTLDAADEQRLQQRVAADAGARSLFDQHAKLDVALRASGSSLAIDEAWLSAQIAATIDEANARPMRIRRWTSFAPLAAAAALAIGITSFFAFRDNGTTTVAVDGPGNSVTGSDVKPVPVIEVAIAAPPEEPRQRPGYATVSVGAPANLTPQIVAALYLARDMSDDSRVTIRAAGRRSPDAFD
jgi:hypothetical protein